MADGDAFTVIPKSTLKMSSTPIPAILVVDDEPEITASIADQFCKSYNVMTASTAAQALDILREYDISVILSDQRMPDTTGIKLLTEAFLSKPDSVRILMTGYADLEVVIQAVNEGRIFFYLQKPWRTDELNSVIAAAFEHNKILREKRLLVEELQSINAELEQRVKERTMQLEQHSIQLEEANRKILELVNVDPLTGVANRRCLYERLSLEVDRALRLKMLLTVIMFDIDHFKAVNDTFGHAMGDRVLQAIARTISAETRTYDLLARYGGEEFIIFMPGTDIEEARTVAERYRTSIGDIVIEGLPVRMTASFGVATLKSGDNPESLIERADKAMYLAKQKGRNRVERDQNN